MHFYFVTNTINYFYLLNFDNLYLPAKYNMIKYIYNLNKCTFKYTYSGGVEADENGNM